MAVDISGNSLLGLSSAIIQNCTTAVVCDNSQVSLNDGSIIDVDTVLQSSGTSTAILSNCIVDGNSTDEGFKITGTGGNIQIQSSSLVNFTNISHILFVKIAH